MSTFLDVMIQDHIAEIIIDKPPVNALNSTEWFALADIITQTGQRDDVRVIVIRAQGRGFCAGVDIKRTRSIPRTYS